MEVENQEQVVDTQEEVEVKTFTEEEVQKMLQVETDKRVNGALEKAQAKWKEEFEAKLVKEKSEAEKLASMSEEEKFKAQLEKEKNEFETERQKFMRERMELQTVKELSSVGLPTEFSQYVVADSAEAVKENISTFKAQWEQAIEKAVNERLKGKTPSAPMNTKDAAVTKEQFKAMDYKQKMEIYNANPDLYNQLRKG